MLIQKELQDAIVQLEAQVGLVEVEEELLQLT
jgi:hypothetical protein